MNKIKLRLKSSNAIKTFFFQIRKLLPLQNLYYLMINEPQVGTLLTEFS